MTDIHHSINKLNELHTNSSETSRLDKKTKLFTPVFSLPNATSRWFLNTDCSLLFLQFFKMLITCIGAV